MKKINLLLLFIVFFSSCPFMEDIDNGDYMFIHIENNTDRLLNLSVKFKDSKDSKIYEISKDSLVVGKSGFNYALWYKEKPEYPFEYFVLSCVENNIVVTSLFGDTLANWNDSSAVFEQKYWELETEKNGEIHCTLSLTDDVLRVK